MKKKNTNIPMIISKHRPYFNSYPSVHAVQCSEETKHSGPTDFVPLAQVHVVA